MRPLESVPNFSEGRDRAAIDALAEALGQRARLLDVHADEDHNRSVFTLVGDEDALIESLLSGIACAKERIDLRRHEGAHPRIGAADVVPIVPLVREEMARRLETGELAPDFGPSRLDERAGGVLIGARRPLIAFNVNLRGPLDAAREIARVVRERDGGFPGVRALGLDLPRAGLVQGSMNVEDYEAAAPHEIVERVEPEAAQRGAKVVGSELVGLMPAGAAVAAAGAMLHIEGFDSSRVLELRLLDE